MKFLFLMMSFLLLMTSSHALTCEGQGYSVNINGSTLNLTGNGTNISTTIQDYGNYYTGNVHGQEVRSVSLAPFSGLLTIIGRGGARNITVSCSF